MDIYRCRWVIEEFFKALKTGCLYEERHLEERESLLIALVMFLPIACQVLWLRSRSRAQPDASAEGLINELQLKVVRRFSDFKLPNQPTVRQLVWAVASMGGHLKNNGDPGWQTLGRAGAASSNSNRAGEQHWIPMKCDQWKGVPVPVPVHEFQAALHHGNVWPNPDRGPIVYGHGHGHAFGSRTDFCFFPLGVICRGDASSWSRLAERVGG